MENELMTEESARRREIKRKRYEGVEGRKRLAELNAFGDAFAQAMVNNLNRKVKEENPD